MKAAAPSPTLDRRPEIAARMTPWAPPGVKHIVCWGATPVQALRKVLDAIGRDANGVRPLAIHGETALLDNAPGSLPLAMVRDQLAPAEVSAALDRIRAGALS